MLANGTTIHNGDMNIQGKLRVFGDLDVQGKITIKGQEVFPGQGGGTDPGGSWNGEYPPGVTSQADKFAWELWVILLSKGYSKAAAAGILGNVQGEAGVSMNPDIAQIGGPAYGIVQWDGSAYPLVGSPTYDGRTYVQRLMAAAGITWQTVEDLIADMMEYINSGKGDFDQWMKDRKDEFEKWRDAQQNDYNTWFESIKNILAQIDPGGTMLLELMDARVDLQGVRHESISKRLIADFNYLYQKLRSSLFTIEYGEFENASAVIGLEKIIAGEAKVLSVNGKIGAVMITKSDLGLENAITELPYANETTDGILTAEMYQKLLNSGEGDYVLPIAGIDKLGGVKLGDLLTIDETGKLSAIKQTDYNFTLEMKQKLDFLQNYSAGQNINIDADGVRQSLCRL